MMNSNFSGNHFTKRIIVSSRGTWGPGAQVLATQNWIDRPKNNAHNLSKQWTAAAALPCKSYDERCEGNGLLQYPISTNTTDAVLEFIDDIFTSFNKDVSTMTIFLDFSKAFHTLNHDILVSKLACYGLRSVAGDWFWS